MEPRERDYSQEMDEQMDDVVEVTDAGSGDEALRRDDAGEARPHDPASPPREGEPRDYSQEMDVQMDDVVEGDV